MVTPVFSRAIVIVLDGAGCGELPDASAYGDEGSAELDLPGSTDLVLVVDLIAAY